MQNKTLIFHVWYIIMFSTFYTKYIITNNINCIESKKEKRNHTNKKHNENKLKTRKNERKRKNIQAIKKRSERQTESK